MRDTRKNIDYFKILLSILFFIFFQFISESFTLNFIIKFGLINFDILQELTLFRHFQYSHNY